MADVFVSYAREDQPAVRRLHEALAERGRETWVDWEGIEPSDEWLRSILEAIDSADAVVVVLSPDWLASEVCRAEAEHAIASGKRLIPVVTRDVDSQRGSIPPALAELNWVFAREGFDDVGVAADAIVRALDTNLELVRTHTLVLTRARAWESAGRRKSPLLRGEELRRAEEWLARAAAGTRPAPTDLQAAFVAASRSAARRRTRLAVGGSLSVAAVSVLLAALALVSRSQAVHQSHVASSRELTAEAAAELASDPELSLLLAQQALKSNPNAAARLAFVTALDNTTVRSIVHFGGVNGGVIGIAWSPKQTLAALAGQDGSVGLWAPVADRIVRQMKANSRGVNAVAFSPDGRLVAAGGDDDLVHLWDVSTGRLVGSLRGHSGFILDVAFSPDGRFVAAGGDDGKAFVWNVATGAQVGKIDDPGHITGIAIGPGNRFVVTANETSGYTKVWNPAGWAAVAGYRPKLHSQSPYHLALSPDGRVVAIAGLDGSVRLWSWLTRAVPRVLAGSPDPMIAVSFSRDGRLLAAGGQDGIARVWNVATGRVSQAYPGNRGVVDDVAFSPSANWLVTAGADGTARLWEVTAEIGATERVLHSPSTTQEFITGAISPKGDLVAASSLDGVVRAWRTHGGGLLWQRAVDSRGGPVRLSFAANGSLIAAPAVTGVKILRARDGALVRAIPAQAEISVGLSPSGALVAAGSRDEVRVWKVGSGKLVYSKLLARAQGSPDDVQFSPDGRLLAIAIDGGQVLLWDSSTGRQVRALNGPTDPVLQVAFSPDGTLLAGGSGDKRAWLWSVETGKVVRTFEGDTGPVGSVAVSPDGELLATGSDDHTARIWDLRTGSETRLLSGDTDWVTSVGFTPDSHSVVTTSLDSTLRVWDACSWCGSAAELNAHAKPALVRCLTPDELATYLHRQGAAPEPCAA